MVCKRKKKLDITMDTKQTQLYESPEIRIVEIAVEGIVCQSGGTEKFTTGNKSYGEDDFE